MPRHIGLFVNIITLQAKTIVQLRQIKFCLGRSGFAANMYKLRFLDSTEYNFLIFQDLFLNPSLLKAQYRVWSKSFFFMWIKKSLFFMDFLTLDTMTKSTKVKSTYQKFTTESKAKFFFQYLNLFLQNNE